MFKEILRGKAIFRVVLFSALTKFFHDHQSLVGSHELLEIGFESASHQRTYPKKWNICKTNYIKEKDVEHVVDANKTFPFKDDAFDGTLILNSVSVIQNIENCLRESVRVSKKFVLFNAPLISGIAKHPKDFNRFTEDHLIDILTTKIDYIDTYEIIPIGGSFTSALILIDVYLHFRIVKLIVYPLAIFFDKIDRRINRSCPSQYLVYITLKA